MSSFYLPLILTILGNVLYHSFNKSVPSTANPIASLVVTYVTALIASLALLPFHASGTGVLGSLKTVGWTSAAIGIAVIGVELGYLLAYRAGWNVGLAPIIVTVSITVLLLPIGVLLFKEQVSFINVLGIVLCVAGLVLVHHK